MAEETEVIEKEGETAETKEAKAKEAANGVDKRNDNGGVAEDTDAIIADLKKKLEQETSARSEAERRAAASQGAAVSAQTEVQDRNLQLVTTAIETVKTAQTMLKQQFKEAIAANDADAMAEIQEQMATRAAELVQLQNGKASLEEEKKNPPRKQPIQYQSDDPVEVLATQLSPRSAAWVRAHPEYARNERLYRKMARAHEDAIDDGVVGDTDEYFEYVENRLGLRRAPTDGESLSVAAKPTARRGADSSPPSMPVSRANGTSKSPPLTAAEKEIAESLGMKEEEYKKNRDALKAEGRIH